MVHEGAPLPLAKNCTPSNPELHPPPNRSCTPLHGFYQNYGSLPPSSEGPPVQAVLLRYIEFFESNALHIVRLAAFAPSGHMIRGRLAAACRFLLTDDRARLKALLMGGNTRPCWSPRGQREEESTLWLKLRGCSLCLSGSKLHFLPRLRKSSSMASFQRASRGALLRTAETAASIAS